ncbi:MAG: hypothetical protein QM754_12360 [Tepidisphaeraceae bacterium]
MPLEVDALVARGGLPAEADGAALAEDGIDDETLVGEQAGDVVDRLILAGLVPGGVGRVRHDG